VKGVDETMRSALLRTDKEITEIYKRHLNTAYRVCFAYMKNAADTEDIVQEAFYKLMSHEVVFESTEHEKAWLIRTASNLCKNTLRHWWRKRKNIEDCEYLQDEKGFEIDETLSMVMELPDKYKNVVYLYYYEGYDSNQIANILDKPRSTIRNYLSEARKILKNQLGENYLEEQTTH
jgi:RNA polymerase sigma-70 factor (ECF subfamily)